MKKLPLSIRLPLIVLCAVFGYVLIAGFAEFWPVALPGAIAGTICLCYLVRSAYVCGLRAGAPRLHWTFDDTRRYARKLRRS